MRTLAFAFGACIALASGNMVSTPGGYKIHKDCIEQVAPGVIPDTKDMKACHTAPGAPLIQTYAMEVNTAGNEEVTQMNTTWNVPALPVVNEGETVYFWPGFKSKEPVMGYPVLQPVLQDQDAQGYWAVQSWFVWGQQGVAKTGPSIQARQGDVITSYMQYHASEKVWDCSATNVRTGEKSVLQIRDSQTQFTKYQYAMLVLETISVDSYCNRYPADSTNVTFSGVKVNDKTFSKWANAKYTETKCGEKMTPLADGGLTMSWKNHPSQ